MDESHHAKDQVTPLAITNWRDIRKKFGIKEKNRRGHMYLVGKTGTGKSTLLATMAISDISQGNGIAVIDPHGDLARTLLDHIPPSRRNDVIYFDPGDLAHPLGLNPLEKLQPDRHHLVVSGLISVFRKIWSEFWGPRLEHILRHALFTLLEYPGSTLLDIPRLLTEPDFRQKALLHLTHVQVRAFWENEFDKYSAWLRSEAVAPILNKMGHFLTSLPLRNIVGQAHNSFRMRTVMDEGKILIVNLAKGKIGEDNCALLGSMLVNLTYLAAMSRAEVPEENRKSFYLYVDEFHSFVTLSFADILSEARKYGLNLILAHQYVNQLHEKVRDAIFGNVGTMISFRVGAEDAECFAKEFAPAFDAMDFTNLPNYHLYLKLMIDGVTSEPFSATTLPLPERGVSKADEVAGESRKKYGRPRTEIEKDILMRYRTEGRSKDRQERLF